VVDDRNRANRFAILYENLAQQIDFFLEVARDKKVPHYSDIVNFTSPLDILIQDNRQANRF